MASREQVVLSAAQLAAMGDDVVIADVRWYLAGKEGRDEYQRAHIPGAYFVDLETELASPPGSTGGRHPLPSADTFAKLMSRLGVTRDSIVVAYDDMSGAIAGRLWWLMRYFGLDGARVLDGGLQAWTGPLTSAEPSETPAPLLELVGNADMVVDAADVAAMFDDGADGLLIDARALERYRGDVEPIDPRAGHIPGAVNLPWRGNLDAGVLMSDERLRERFATSAATIVAYCGSGVTACHDLLALAVAGRSDAKLYAGSWSDWSSDPDRPAASGDDP